MTMREDIVQWLDVMGSCTAQFDEETNDLLVRGVPCADFQHRGFDVVRDRDEFTVKDALGVTLGVAASIDDAMILGVRQVSGLDITQEPPRLRPISPAAARMCRDWSLHVACFQRPGPIIEERADTLAAALDALGSGCLAAIEGPVGSGAHHIVAQVATELLDAPPLPHLEGARVLELDWLKMNAGQTPSNALGPGEGLARTLDRILETRHVPVIPRGRAGELAHVMPPDMPGIVLCSRPAECLALSLFARIIRIRLPEAEEHRLRGVLRDEARKLEAEFGVVITDQAIQYALANGVRSTEEGIGPLAFIDMPGAVVALLKLGCQRAIALARRGVEIDCKPLVTPTALAMGLINLGVTEEAVMNSVFPEKSEKDRSS